MPRIYNTCITEVGDKKSYIVRVKTDRYDEVDIPVDREVFDAINELQRELWRLERRESRHCVHIDAIPDCYIPHEQLSVDPEDQILAAFESKNLKSALTQIPDKQRRRFLLYHEYGMSSSAIAEIEGCSERSIQYSLNLAKRNLRDILEDTLADR